MHILRHGQGDDHIRWSTRQSAFAVTLCLRHAQLNPNHAGTFNGVTRATNVAFHDQGFSITYVSGDHGGARRR